MADINTISFAKTSGDKKATMILKDSDNDGKYTDKEITYEGDASLFTDAEKAENLKKVAGNTTSVETPPASSFPWQAPMAKMSQNNWQMLPGPTPMGFGSPANPGFSSLNSGPLYNSYSAATTGLLSMPGAFSQIPLTGFVGNMWNDFYKFFAGKNQGAETTTGAGAPAPTTTSTGAPATNAGDDAAKLKADEDAKKLKEKEDADKLKAKEEEDAKKLKDEEAENAAKAAKAAKEGGNSKTSNKFSAKILERVKNNTILSEEEIKNKFAKFKLEKFSLFNVAEPDKTRVCINNQKLGDKFFNASLADA